MRLSLSLTLSTSLLALAAATIPAGASAQTVDPNIQPKTQADSPVEPTPTPTPTDETEEPSSTNLSAENAAVDQPIIVTGSRIRRPDFDTANPMISIGSDQIEQSGTTNLTDFLTGYPALQGSMTSADNSGAYASIGYTGLNLLDLRNLGADRTLVLVDSRRHVSGVPGSQAIDINSIPSDLVERVDVLTGGASAIYGADGVSGVVNFVLKRNFQGLTARAQTGISERGDAGQRLLSVTAGHNFAGGRGNIAIAYEHGEEDRLETRDRRRLQGENFVAFYLNPDDPENFAGYDGPADNGIPDHVPLSNVRYFDTNRGGGIDVDFDGFPDFFVGPGGNFVAFDKGTFVPDFYQQGGDATLVSDYGNDLLPKIRRDIVNLIGHFDVSPALTLFAEGKFAKNHAFSLGEPSFDYYLLVPFDNAYLPAEVAGDDVLLTRDNFDFGQRSEMIDRKTYRGVVGARGEITDRMAYEVSFVHGQTKVKNTYGADVLTDRFYAALDAVVDPDTGQVTCRINLDPTAWPIQPYNYTRNDGGNDGEFPPVTFQPGECVPINLFGENAPSQAALDFITNETIDRSKITQQVLSGSIAGDIGNLFEFPGGGVLGYAVGAEYRKEKSKFTPDELAAAGLTFTHALAQDVGKFNVKEAFAEVRLPVFTRLPGAHKLELGGAVRFSDYSTIGNTTAYKADLSYAPVRDITFNGTYSTAVRAPNIGELFGGLSQTFNFITDPCNVNQLQNGTEFREENCAAVLASLGADPATYRDFRAANIGGFVGGNPNLAEEEAETWTIGTILQPRFIPGLTARFDWYDIKLRGAINTVTAHEIATLCVDQPSVDNVFCDVIVRQNGGDGTADPGNIVSFTVTPQNVAQFRTSGLDVNLNYRLRTETMGTFSLNLIGNYLKRLEFIGTPGADATDTRGEPFAPKYTATTDLTWKMGKFTVNYGLLWFSKTSRFDNQTMESNPDVVENQYKYLKERWQHDIFGSVDVGEKLEVYGGVNNLFNQKPELGTGTYPVNSIGRYFFTGARVKFKKLY